jgi:hypothetical protein
VAEQPAGSPGDPGVGTSRAHAARGTARHTASAVRRGRSWLRKNGAGESGLAGLTELCIANAAADLLVTVALTSTIFFNVPIGQARGKVGLYLLTTMAPFALLAPVIGPLLDRLHGRRVALAATMLGRAGLCWALVGHTSGLEVYPLALGILVVSRAFSVARAAVTPRVLPHGMTLLSANSRVSLVGALTAGLIAPLGFGIQALLGVSWVLRLAAVAFLASILLCLQLPKHVDSDEGETQVIGIVRSTLGAAKRSQTLSLGGLPVALRTVLPLRALVGFLTLFLAFRFYQSSHSSKNALFEVGIAALIGQAAGIGIGNRLGRRRPELLILVGLLLATGICVFGAIAYSEAVAFVVALVATFGAAIGKLGLDAIIQRDIAENTRNSAFARSETALQLVWVIGAALGLIPWSGRVGFSLAAAGMVAALLMELAGLRGARQRWRDRRSASRSEPPATPVRYAEPPGTTPLYDYDAEYDAQPEPTDPATAPTRRLLRRKASNAGTGHTMVLPFPDDPGHGAGG